MADLISKSDVANLDHLQFRAVINALLMAEANVYGVSLASLNLTARDNDPDGGVDAIVTWPLNVPHEVFKPGENAIQFKTGNLTEAALKKEFAKEGVQSVLRAGGAYRLFYSRDPVAETCKKRLKELGTLCKRRKLHPDKSTILFGDQLARWIAHYPSLVIRSEFGKGYPAFTTVDQWKSSKTFSNPFKEDESRKGIIADIQQFISSQSQERVLRVEGRAGIGKTRTALQAVGNDGVSQRTIYCQNSDDSNAQEFLVRLIADPKAQAIVVFDECSRERQSLFRAYIDISSANIRIICVGIAENLYQPPEFISNFLPMSTLPDATIGDILEAAKPSAPQEIREFGVRLAEGYVKLAIFVLDTLLKDKAFPLTHLVNIPDIQEFLKRFVDDRTRRGIQALSLLGRIGWEGDVRQEAEKVAEAIELPFADLRAAVATLKSRGVVLPRGRYLYVSPDLLAISAAATLWTEFGADLITVVEKLPGREPRRQLLLRLAMIGDHPPVKEAVEKLFADDGLFPTLSDLNQEFASDVYHLLSATSPELAVARLKRLTENATKDELLNFVEGRRNVIWALNSLLRWPNTSLDSAQLLIRFAQAETESLANNSTGVLQTFFHAFLSGSPLPLLERLQLIWPLVNSDAVTDRLLGATLSASALEFHEHRMGGETDNISKKPYPPEWHPATWGVLWEARREAVKQLEQLSSYQDEAGALARKELIQSTSTLTRDGQLDDAIDVLRKLPLTNDEERRSILEAAEHIGNMSSAFIKEEQRIGLQKISEKAFGDSYPDRLRRWVGRRPHTDYDLKGKTGFEAADRNAAKLADEGFKQGISGEQLEWLASPAAENVWAFGNRLGELDAQMSFLPRVIEVTAPDVNGLLLSSYLTGIGATLGIEQKELILDDLAKSHPVLAFGASWRGLSTVKSGARVLRLLKDDRITAEHFKVLQYGSWVTSLPFEVATQIVQAILGKDASQLVIDTVVSLLHDLIRRQPERLGELQDSIWKALEGPANLKGTHSEWEWAELAKISVKLNPGRMTELILAKLKEEHPYISADPLVQALAEATKADPVIAWEKVGAALLSKDTSAFRLKLSLEKWYGELIPENVLIDWAKSNLPRGPRLAAEMVSVGAPLSKRARSLVLAFEASEILSVFASNLQTGSWTGPMSSHTESLIATVKQWELDPNPKIRAFAHRFRTGLEQELKRQKLIEEEGHHF